MRKKMQISLNSSNYLIISLFFGLYALGPIVGKAGTIQVQVHEHLFAEQSDQEYAKQISRIAKAAEMLNYMNLNVEACENFYDYACGNWPQIYPVESSTKRKTTTFDLSKLSYKHKQYRLLRTTEPESEQSNASVDITKMKNFYKSCLYFHKLSNVSTIRNKIQHILNEFGEFPFKFNSTNEEENISNTTEYLEIIAKIKKRYGLNILLQVTTIKDMHNDSNIAIMVGPSRDFTASIQNENQKSIFKNLFTYFNLTETEAATLSEEIWNFEMRLNQDNYKLPTKKILLMEMVKRTPEELQNLYGPELDLWRFINLTSISEIQNTTIYEYLIDYQRHLLEIISTTSATQTINYILYKLAKEFFINPEMNILQRESFCLSKTELYFSKLFEKEIYKQFKTTEMEDDIKSLWENVKTIFKQHLESNYMEWLSPLARKLAMERLETMSLHIQNYENRNFSKELYDLYIPSQSNYVDNMKAILEHLVKNDNPIEDVLKQTDDNTPAYLPIYNKDENVITLPIILLQPNHFWSDHYPNALKFGTLAYLMARQMIYPFDDDNKNSNFVWLDDHSRKAFQQRKQCFKKQYSRYRYNGKYLMESNFQQDNIADTSSIRIAFEAYNVWLHNQTDSDIMQEHLPNLNLHGLELFFLSYAQLFCSDVDQTFKEKVALLDNQVPEKLRVIGSLANLRNFSETFNCTLNSVMNPINKCEMF